MIAFLSVLRKTSIAIFLLMSFSAAFPMSAYGRSTGKDRVAATTYYSTYANTGVGASTSGSSSPPSPSLDMEFSLRLQAIFNLTAVWTRFQDPSPGDASTLQNEIGGMGLGMKIDMPGFFFLFSDKAQSSRETKLYPVNSFLFGEIFKLTLIDTNTLGKTSSTAPRYGFGFDVFPGEQTMYFSLRGAVMSLLGASYISYAWGFGMRF